MLRHLPNLISLLRIVLVAPLILAILHERYEVALVIAAVAGVSDGVDGFLARRFRWQSKLGSILDPAADKLMLVGCMLALGWLHEAPRWLVALADITMDALHAVPNTASKPLFKSIARGRSKAVVQGRLVVARDAVIVLGALAWHRVLHSFEAHPSWISKATTVAQIGFVLLVLATQAFGWRTPMAIPVWVVAVMTAASGIDYVVRWGRMARRELGKL